MANFGYSSLKQRDTLHPDLRMVLDEAIKYYNFTIVCGYRNKIDQNKAFQDKTSKLQYPNSKHNKIPSLAADLTPYPFDPKNDWKDLARFARMMGHIEAAAKRLGISIRLGMDFDQDGSTIDESFKDFPHVELL